MDRTTRIKIIEQIEGHRKSKLLVYFTGDRHPFPARIAEDAVRQIYDHLLSFDGATRKRQRIDLFLYSRGGDVSVPWRIVSMIREFCDEFCVLVPFRAHSAATMIALGADSIVMGRKAELSPIDPTLSRIAVGEATAPPTEISVEDVSSYVSFMRDRAGISDQAALATVVSLLANHLTPLTLGSVNRQYSHIRLLARKLLASRKKKTEEDRLSTIIEAFTEKMYSHGHAIGRKEATELGLDVKTPGDDLEDLMWVLYKEYESMFALNSPLDAEELLASKNVDEYTEPRAPIAAVESVQRLTLFEVSYAFRRKRQVPPNLQLNLPISIALPPGFDPAKAPPAVQQFVQEVVQRLSKELPQMIQLEIARQSPITGIELRHFGGKWKDATS